MAGPDPVRALQLECEETSRVVLALPEESFGLRTRLPAWTVKDLLAHMHRGVERIVTALDAPEPAAADTDSIAYWGRDDPTVASDAIAERAKERAAEFPSGRDLAQAWDALWRRAVRRAAATDPARVVTTWGPRLTLEEFLKTRVLEITVHRMDLEAALGRKGWGTDQAIAIVDDILEGLLGEEPPSALDWDVVDFIEAATGRRPLTERERQLLGPLAARFPLLA